MAAPNRFGQVAELTAALAGARAALAEAVAAKAELLGRLGRLERPPPRPSVASKEELGRQLAAKVRMMPSWPRSWANVSLV